jgi:Cys-rich protein (TIGR01571 family)
MASYSSHPQQAYALPTQNYPTQQNFARAAPMPQHIVQQPNQRRPWNDSLFSCFNNLLPSCFMSFFCQCILLGQISQASGFAPCLIVGCGYVGFFIFFLILGAYLFGIQALLWVTIAFLIWALRKRVRSTRNIAGDDCEDCAVSFFCQACAISQMARDLYQYREQCDEFVCNEDGRPSYSQNQGGVAPTPTWQHNPQPQQLYFAQTGGGGHVHPAQYVGYPPPQSTTAQLVQPPQQPTIVKASWEENIGGASAYPYSPSPANQVASTAPTIVSIQPMPNSNSPYASPAQSRSPYYEEEDPPNQRPR